MEKRNSQLDNYLGIWLKLLKKEEGKWVGSSPYMELQCALHRTGWVFFLPVISGPGRCLHLEGCDKHLLNYLLLLVLSQ